jgi:hypothetical protein
MINDKDYDQIDITYKENDYILFSSVKDDYIYTSDLWHYLKSSMYTTVNVYEGGVVYDDVETVGYDLEIDFFEMLNYWSEKEREEILTKHEVIGELKEEILKEFKII